MTPQQMSLPLDGSLAPPPPEPLPPPAPAVPPDRLRLRSLPVGRALQDSVQQLCRLRQLSPDDLVAAVLVLVRTGDLPVVPDPGGPTAADITVVWKPNRLGAMRRRRVVPTLRVRAPGGVSDADVRRCLALAVALSVPDTLRFADHQAKAAAAAAAAERERALAADRDAARAALERLAFRPLEGGVRSPAQAARVMGFQSEFGCTGEQVSRRFRELAPVFHPDTGLVACPERMRQLIEARRVLLDFVRTG
ncbi:hypothetical protein [Caenispirillum bisanense]|uniref:hypothetical protein n=1 Tax=Caenispirillum bisanense TaxID=414052 RepID=UPI0031DCA360